MRLRNARSGTRASVRVDVDGIAVEATRPSAVGGAAWCAIAGPWEIDYSYANMRAVEAHPFNDSGAGRTLWWLVKRDGVPVGMYSAYVTETYNFSALFTVGILHALAAGADRVYLWLNRHRLYRRLERLRLARVVRIAAGRSRVMFLGTHTADVGGQGIGEAFRDQPASSYLPAIVRMIEAQARALGVEQITFREAAERDAGPFRYPNLWEARDGAGRRILEHAGYRRDAGFPPAYIDLREVQARYPNVGDAVYAFYRHDSAAEFLVYDAARRGWLAEVAPLRAADPDADLPVDVVLRHPSAHARSEATRLQRFREQLFRSGIVPDALVALAQHDRAEGGLTNGLRTAHRLNRLRSVRDELQRRFAAEAAGLPDDAPGAAYIRAREVAAARAPGESADVRRLAAAHGEERALAAEVDPAFASLSSAMRRKYVDLAAGQIRQADLERQRLLIAMGWAADAPPDERAAIEAALASRLAVAERERGRDRELRRLRTEIADLARRTGTRPEDAEPWARAHDLLERHGGKLPEAVASVVERLAAIQARSDQASADLADGEGRLRREASSIQRLLLGQAGPQVRDELVGAMRAEFRREQDRLVTERAGGSPAASPRDRRERLEAALAHHPLDFARLLQGIESLRDSDRQRVRQEHQAHRAAVRRETPNQPGPIPPEFDRDGYLAEGLTFVGRDERVWTNLSDQDRITELYHRTMAKSMIRHDVIDWPYLAAYRAAGRETGDEIYVATLRAGGPAGPIVAAVTLKRSPAGHFRPERIAIGGPAFGAYYSLVILVMANELERGGTLCSLGQTSQGTKLREFGAAFIDVREYTRFRGLIPVVFGFEWIRRNAFKHIHVDRILELAALPPEERDEAAKRHGIRWHI